MSASAPRPAAPTGARLPVKEKPIWEMDDFQVETWIRTTQTLLPKAAATPEERKEKMQSGQKLLANLMATIKSLLKHNSREDSEPPTKKVKKEHKNHDEAPPVEDPHGIWVGQTEDPPSSQGAVVVQLTTAGLVNALAAQPGGLVDSKLMPVERETKFDSLIPTAANITYKELRHAALALHRVIQTRTEADFLWSTPSRIQDMLATDMAAHEFKAVRRRVFETVIEGRGRNQGGPEEGEDLAVAPRTAEHDIEKDKICKVCGNKDQAEFTLDRKNGDIICTMCGTVAMESLMHEGSQFRKFEGEADRNHHGDAPNKLFSNAHNMATTLGGMQVTSSAGGPGFGSQKKGIENVLRNAHAYTELNISQFGKGERKTRIGYKDRQKKDAFIQMTHIGDALHLHEAVVQRAKEVFAGFRDDRELVQSFKAVVCACLIIAFEEMSASGMQLMKQKQMQDAEALLSNRANRRNELHNASMAGKGGLLLDFSKVKAEKEEETAISAIEKKQASTWDLDDCRSWLLEASRSIAQQWMMDRKAGKPNVPQGTQEELEGKLVEHTITLCDQLEAELKAKAKKKTGFGGRKISTPRVKDMAHLSIRWQHSHERGSGGKGGVGNSGRDVNGAKQGEHAGRTAGQVLLLKTSKKLSIMLKDPAAGEAFHQELRSLVGRQDARKLKGQREESARHRINQMKRKPWLLAKAEEVTSTK